MKRVLCIIFVLLLAFSIVVSTEGVLERIDYNIKIGNRDLNSQKAIFSLNGNTYMSLRDICSELNVPIYWNDQDRTVLVDIYNKHPIISDKTKYNSDGVIPDAQTAISIGKIVLEKYSEKNLEYETNDKTYFLDVVFLQEVNSWKVYQTFKLKNKEGWAASGISLPYIILNKNTGEVLSLNTYSTFE